MSIELNVLNYLQDATQKIQTLQMTQNKHHNKIYNLINVLKLSIYKLNNYQVLKVNLIK